MDPRSVIAYLLGLGFLIFMLGITTMLVSRSVNSALPPLQHEFAIGLLQTLKEIILFVLGALAAFLASDKGALKKMIEASGDDREGLDGTLTCPRCEAQFRDQRNNFDEPIKCPKCTHEWMERKHVG